MHNVVVFGSLNMDLAIESERMPKQGETIPGWGFFVNAGGKGANQAVAAAKSGVPTYLIGAVGNDAFGDQLVSGLAGYGVRVDEVFRAGSTETGVAVVLRAQGDNRIILSPGANHALGIDEVNSGLDMLARKGDVFLAQLECDLDTTVEALVALGPKTAIVTLGGRGSAALADGRLIRQEAQRVKVADTTAAGDTFIGVIAAAQVSGLSIEEGMRWASCAAGITASRVGAQQSIPTAVEVDTYLKEVCNE